MKKNITIEQRDEIRNKIRELMYKDGNNVATFCKKNKMSRTSIDKWFGEDRLPGIDAALRLEKISNFSLTKEYLCPHLPWNT